MNDPPRNPCFDTSNPCGECAYRAKFWVCPKWLDWSRAMDEHEKQEGAEQDE